MDFEWAKFALRRGGARSHYAKVGKPLYTSVHKREPVRKFNRTGGEMREGHSDVHYIGPLLNSARSVLRPLSTISNHGLSYLGSILDNAML